MNAPIIDYAESLVEIRNLLPPVTEALEAKQWEQAVELSAKLRHAACLLNDIAVVHNCIRQENAT